MSAIYLIAGAIAVGLVFEKSRRWGPPLLIVIVLGMLLVAQRKGTI